MTAAATIPSLADLWREAEALEARINADPFASDADADLERMFGLEDQVRTGAIRTRADAIAKLKFAGLAFSRGHRSDEADGVAFAEALTWLEAN